MIRAFFPSVVFGFLIPLALSLLAVGGEKLGVVLVIVTGSVAYCMMCINMVIAMRLRVFDWFFAGLDKQYHAHKWAGISIIALALLHENMDMPEEVGEQPGALASLAEDVAELVIYPMIALLLISFFKRIPWTKIEIPYLYWRWTHKLLGPITLALAFHMLFVKTPYNNADPLGLYLIAVSLLAILAFAYVQVFPSISGRNFTVRDVEKLGDATVLTLTPDAKRIAVRPGSFAFLSFATPTLTESHPFTVSKVEEDGSVQFSIKGLGDFSRRIQREVSPGDTARIDGVFGRFHFKDKGNTQIWLAAGIGITPFIGWVNALPENLKSQIHLVYCVRNKSEAVGLDQLKSAAGKHSQLNLYLQESEQDGRLNAEKLATLLQIRIQTADLWYCGPAQLRKSLVKDLTEMGARPRSVHFERFEFR